MTSSTTSVLLTAPGRSAIAVIAVAGPHATGAIERFFQPLAGRAMADRSVGRVIYGTWNDGEGVVVRRCEAERWEIHPHGGSAAASAILDDLKQAGCLSISWQDEVMQSTPDALSAAATIALSRATTKQAVAHLLAQQQGALRSALQAIIEQLNQQQFAAALSGLHALRESSRWGLHLTTPWRVMLCGSPNVGKSSLINALLGYGRAIVFDRPGTTRDVLTATTAIAGWPVELADTAGLRSSENPLEAAGIARTRAALATADLVIPVIDHSQPLTAEDRTLLAMTGTELVVANKADLPGNCALNELQLPAHALLSTSAVTGQGIESLLERIARHLVPVQPAFDEPTLFTSEQVAAVKRAIMLCDDDQPTAARKLIEVELARDHST